MSEWRDIGGWEGKYQISDTGLVRRLDPSVKNGFNACVLQRPTKTGYLQVWLGGWKGKNHYVHRLVAFAFIGPPPTDCHEVAHWDGVKSNNAVENLRWATRAENNEDKRRQGRLPKLTITKVQEIRKQLETGTPKVEIARSFGVSATMISHIAHDRAWRGV